MTQSILTFLLLVLLRSPIVNGQVEFSGPFGIAVGPDDVIYVADIDKARVTKLNRDGHLLGHIDDIPGYGRLKGPFDVQVAVDGSIVIADTRAHRVVVLDPQGRLQFVLGTASKGAASGEFSEPHFVAVTPEGDILVADTFNARIQRFDRNGKFVSAFGKVGDGPGEFLQHGYLARLDVDTEGNVYVREFDGGRVQKFSADGKPLATFSGRGTGRGELDEGYGLKIIDGKITAPTRSRTGCRFSHSTDNCSTSGLPAKETTATISTTPSVLPPYPTARWS